MPFPRNHLLLSVIGSGYSPDELWVWGLHVDRAEPMGTAELQAAMDAVSAYQTNPNNQFSSAFKLLELKSAIIGPDGRYPEGSNSRSLVLTTPVSGAVGAKPPGQLTLAVSLRTAIPRGRGNRGRFYPPGPTWPIGDDGRIGAPQAQESAGAAKAMIEGVQAACGAPVVVASALASTLRPVTAVEVGRVVDTQRRRRSSFKEDHQTVAITPLA